VIHHYFFFSVSFSLFFSVYVLCFLFCFGKIVGYSFLLEADYPDERFYSRFEVLTTVSILRFAGM